MPAHERRRSSLLETSEVVRYAHTAVREVFFGSQVMPEGKSYVVECRHSGKRSPEKTCKRSDTLLIS
jgi:hypothetical protein